MDKPTPSPFASRAVTVVQISDPTAIGENIEVLRQDAVQLKSRRLRARRVVIRLDSCVVVYHSTNLPIRARTSAQQGLVAYDAFGPRAAGTVNGLPIRANHILVVQSEIEVEFVVAAGYESVAFLLPPEFIRLHLRGRRREKEFHDPSGVELLQTSHAAVSALFNWGKRLIDRAARSPDIFDLPQTRSVAEIELVETLLFTLGSAVDAELDRPDRTRQSHSRLVKIAEDYALNHAAEHLYVTDLCRTTGVSERTLQGAFKTIMGISPVAYLARLRLHRVRQALRAGTPHSTTVTGEALKWGFWHFGDFSRAYKRCFRELPSVTLRRSRAAGNQPD